jgi:hypothetical protein
LALGNLNIVLCSNSLKGNQMIKQILVIVLLPLFYGCAVGNDPWADYKNEYIGKKATVLDPTRFGNAGELIRADFLISGDGFTHVTKNENGDIVQHWFVSEVLPNFVENEGSIFQRGHKEWVGKCKYYYIVDSKTNIIKSWGYDKGGNPLSCRVWL